jgi:hypothetical protein
LGFQTLPVAAAMLMICRKMWKQRSNSQTVKIYSVR